MPTWVPRWNRAVNNRVVGLFAPHLPPYALVIHRGRRSADLYRTPVLGFRSDRTMLVALPYGERSDWVRNLLAADEGVVLRAGKRWQMTQIVVVERGSELVSGLPRGLRLVARTPRVLAARLNPTPSQHPEVSPGCRRRSEVDPCPDEH